MHQKITIVGYLGRDPEMRTLPDGETNVTNFSVATTRTWKNKDGSKNEETTWWKVEAWRGLAGIIDQYFSKGDPILIEGRIKPDENGNPRIWESRDGEARASFELVMENFSFLPGRGVGGTGEDEADEEYEEEYDSGGIDDIPF